MRAYDRLKPKPRAKRQPLLPVIRDDAWGIVWRCAHRPLLPGRRGPGLPFVALARKRGDGLDYLLRDSLPQLGLTYEEAEEFALENLCQTSVQWQEMHRDDNADRAVLFGLQGNIYTASRVLDPRAMRQAHELTNSRLLLVGIPSSRELYATDASPTADHVMFDAFVEWVARHYERARGIDAITKQVFLVRNGAIDGLYKKPET